MGLSLLQFMLVAKTAECFPIPINHNKYSSTHKQPPLYPHSANLWGSRDGHTVHHQNLLVSAPMPHVSSLLSDIENTCEHPKDTDKHFCDHMFKAAQNGIEDLMRPLGHRLCTHALDRVVCYTCHQMGSHMRRAKEPHMTPNQLVGKECSRSTILCNSLCCHT